jgi:pantoate--beta-alanine ligase
MKILTTFDDVRLHTEGSVGLVPTMGYLHEGHLSLVDRSVAECDTTVVSIFVNPLQFGDPTDLERYPRDLERDVSLAAEAGAGLVFAPSVDYMYPTGAVTTVTVEEVSDHMEGRHRPGHFVGVATVVAKLLAGVQPHRAYFGAKDAQQVAVVTTMARDLSFPVTIRTLPIVREEDGLALSSRNVHLDDADRASALTLSRGLSQAADLFEGGCRSSDELIDAALAPMLADPGVMVDYVELADAATASPMPKVGGRQFLAVAATVGSVRLIDNVSFDADRGLADRGTRLAGPSMVYGGT